MSRKIKTAADLKRMSPPEIDAHFREGIVWHLEDAPPHVVARARERVLRRIGRTETTERL